MLFGMRDFAGLWLMLEKAGAIPGSSLYVDSACPYATMCASVMNSEA